MYKYLSIHLFCSDWLLSVVHKRFVLSLPFSSNTCPSLLIAPSASFLLFSIDFSASVDDRLPLLDIGLTRSLLNIVSIASWRQRLTSGRIFWVCNNKKRIQIFDYVFRYGGYQMFFLNRLFKHTICWMIIWNEIYEDDRINIFIRQTLLPNECKYSNDTNHSSNTSETGEVFVIIKPVERKQMTLLDVRSNGLSWRLIRYWNISHRHHSDL